MLSFLSGKNKVTHFQPRYSRRIYASCFPNVDYRKQSDFSHSLLLYVGYQLRIPLNWYSQIERKLGPLGVVTCTALLRIQVPISTDGHVS